MILMMMVVEILMMLMKMMKILMMMMLINILMVIMMMRVLMIMVLDNWLEDKRSFGLRSVGSNLMPGQTDRRRQLQ